MATKDCEERATDVLSSTCLIRPPSQLFSSRSGTLGPQGTFWGKCVREKEYLCSVKRSQFFSRGSYTPAGELKGKDQGLSEPATFVSEIPFGVRSFLRIHVQKSSS